MCSVVVHLVMCIPVHQWSEVRQRSHDGHHAYLRSKGFPGHSIDLILFFFHSACISCPFVTNMGVWLVFHKTCFHNVSCSQKLRKVVPWLRRLVSRRHLTTAARVRVWSVWVGFMVDIVALGQILLRAFCFPLSVSFHRGSPYSYIIWGWTLGPLVGAVRRHSLTPSTWTARTRNLASEFP
jgi:hypothetical protein